MPFYRFYDELMELKRRFKGVEGVFCTGFICHDDDPSILKSVRCPAGTAKLSVLPDGSVYPCYLFFHYKEFELGNILKDDFRKIWENPILTYFRTFSGNSCPESTCTLFTSCHGGCPAVSYIFKKNLALTDPRCIEASFQL